MTHLKRIRVDPDGLITQTQQGFMQRLPLARPQIEAIKEHGAMALSALSNAHPALQRFFDGRGGLDARLEIVDEDADCLNRPLRIYYGLEPRCNLRCPFCGPRDLHDKCVPAAEDMENFLLREVAEAGAFQIQLTGGEIGIRGFDLIPVLEKTRQHGLAVILSTNGVWQCIDRKDEFLQRLAAFDNIIQAKISIEGTPEFHDSVRGPGTYREAVDTLARLSEYGLNPRISTTLFRSSCNSEQLNHLVGLAKQYAAGFQPIPLRPIGRAHKMQHEIPTVPQIEEYTRNATRLRQETGVAITFNFDIFEEGRQVPIYDLHRPVSCGAPLWGVHITHTGAVYPCGFAQEAGKGKAFLAGVISLERSLLDIWLHSDVLKAVRHAGKAAECRACGHYGRGCWGGCWVVGWIQTGRIDGMDGYCIKG